MSTIIGGAGGAAMAHEPSAHEPSTQEPSTLWLIWRVVKLQFTNTWNVVWLPWIILIGIFCANLAIWTIIAVSTGDPDMKGTEYSGSAFFIFIYMLVVAVQAINLTFPLALGFGATRRDYYLGTALAWVILAAMLAVGLTVLAWIESATHGWGLNASFFNVMYFGGPNPLTHLFTVFAGLLFFFAVGMFAGTVYVRWRANGLLVAGAILALLLIGAIALISFSNSWPAVGRWFVAAGPTGVVAWSLVFTVVAGAVGFRVLRRAAPKN